MLTLDLSDLSIEGITWLPAQSVKRNRNRGGRFRGAAAGPLLLEGTVKVAALAYQQAREFEAKLEALEGAITPFQLIIPVVCIPSGVAQNINHGVVTVLSGSGHSLTTTGWPANTQNIFKAGDLLRLSSPSKIYKVAANAHSNASGNCTIQLTRTLWQTPVGGETLIFNPASLTVTQPVPAQEYEIPNTKYSAFEIDFEEVVL